MISGNSELSAETLLDGLACAEAAWGKAMVTATATQVDFQWNPDNRLWLFGLSDTADTIATNPYFHGTCIDDIASPYGFRPCRVVTRSMLLILFPELAVMALEIGSIN
jgi:hypothetical protein